MLLKGKGILRVDKRKHRIIIELDDGLGDYYRWLASREDWIVVHRPTYGYHITITNNKLNHNVNWRKALRINNMPVEFFYSAGLVRGGQSKGFTNYYLRIVGDEIDYIKDAIGLIEGSKYLGAHITIGNTKSGVATCWPKMITLK